MKEKRKLNRLQLLYHLRVIDRKRFKLLGHLVDIHREGMRIISEQPLKPDTVHEIKILLPEALHGREEMHSSAKVIWCGPYVNPLFHQTGFRFQIIEKAFVKLLESLIQKYGFHDVFQSRAVQYYRGIEGYNCAQAMLQVFKDRGDLNEDQMIEYAGYGGGCAEGGICGALYAAEQLAADQRLSNQIRQIFEDEVGSIYCDDILELGRLSCAGCICTACQILMDLLSVS